MMGAASRAMEQAGIRLLRAAKREYQVLDSLMLVIVICRVAG
jgi:hypothetical protein